MKEYLQKLVEKRIVELEAQNVELISSLDSLLESIVEASQLQPVSAQQLLVELVTIERRKGYYLTINTEAGTVSRVSIPDSDHDRGRISVSELTKYIK